MREENKQIQQEARQLQTGIQESLQEMFKQQLEETKRTLMGQIGARLQLGERTAETRQEPRRPAQPDDDDWCTADYNYRRPMVGKIEVNTFPTSGKLRNWLMDLQGAVIAASGVAGDGPISWFRAVRVENSTEDQLADPHFPNHRSKRYAELDRSLKTGVSQAIVGRGNHMSTFANQIFREDD